MASASAIQWTWEEMSRTSAHTTAGGAAMVTDVRISAMVRGYGRPLV
jgi:hypothetical protein